MPPPFAEHDSCEPGILLYDARKLHFYREHYRRKHPAPPLRPDAYRARFMRPRPWWRKLLAGVARWLDSPG